MIKHVVELLPVAIASAGTVKVNNLLVLSGHPKYPSLAVAVIGAVILYKLLAMASAHLAMRSAFLRKHMGVASPQSEPGNQKPERVAR